jgi:hypothetical protein
MVALGVELGMRLEARNQRGAREVAKTPVRAWLLLSSPNTCSAVSPRMKHTFHCVINIVTGKKEIH